MSDSVLIKLHSNVAIPNIIAVILQANEALMVLTTAVRQQLICQRPFLFAELALLEQLIPLRSPQVILNHLLIVLVVSYCTLVAKDLHLVPLALRFSVLRLRRDHIIQRGRLTDTRLSTQLSVGVILVIQHLALRG